jgi:hypothetical protein
MHLSVFFFFSFEKRQHLFIGSSLSEHSAIYSLLLPPHLIYTVLVNGRWAQDMEDNIVVYFVGAIELGTPSLWIITTSALSLHVWRLVVR